MNENMFLGDPIEIEMNSDWVSEGLETEFRNWTHHSPVFISAQTGHGKNHFIMKKLIPHAMQTNQQVFLFSNRTALNVQQKEELLDTLRLPNVYTSKELERKENFGSVTVLNYQSALSYLNKLTGNENIPIGGFPLAGHFGRGYVVLDEAHFFLSDAIFNADTERILQKIMITFPFYVCIYMTATPDNILEIIKYLEKINVSRLRVSGYEISDNFYKRGIYAPQNEPVYIPRALHIYRFPRDYSGYKVSFFYNIESLYDRLSRASSTDKWLCFINDKKRQSEISKRLNKDKHIVGCFDSSKKDNEKIWNELINGDLPNNVFLTTSALDNGVNITDPGLHNIVIECTDKVSFLQCLGRKRKQDGEQVHLYVRVPTPDFIEERLNYIKDRLRFINKYLENPYKFLEREWSNFHKKYRDLFRIEFNQRVENSQFVWSYQLVLNEFAHTEFLNQWNFYIDLQNRIRDSDNHGISEAYPKMVMEWLGLDQPIDWFDAADIKAKHARTELQELLNSHIQSGIPADEHEEFCNKFKEFVGIILYYDKITFGSRLGPTELSSHLEELEVELEALYKIEGRETWKVSKLRTKKKK